MSAEITVSELQQAADQCVKCAVCLPHCPTYALSPEETESPRGRITLLQGIVHDRLTPTPEVHRHLENCLSCGRCEAICPAQVPYTRLLDGTRYLMNDRADLRPPPASIRRRLAAWLLTSPASLKLLAASARLANRIRLQRLVGHTTPGRWLNWLPAPVAAGNSVRSVQSDLVDAWLFTGCLPHAFEPDIVRSARYAAAQFGISLRPVPPGLCCGALYQHMGNTDRSAELTRRNLASLSGDGKPVASLLSGCTRGLRDGLSQSTDDAAPAVSARLSDLFELFSSSGITPARRDTAGKAGLYAPCSLDKTETATLLRVLDSVSNVKTTVLGKAHGCCGAAGNHMIEKPELADQLASPIVESIIDHKLTHVLTPNLGCAWHLRANLARRGHTAIVEHPVQWLARQLPPAETGRSG